MCRDRLNVSADAGKRQPGSLNLAAREWHDELARLVENMDDPALPSLLTRALEKVSPFDGMVITAYRCGEKPVHLFDNYDAKKRKICVDTYLKGAYLLDPFYHACGERVPSAFYRLQDFAPDNFRNSEYYRTYYARTGESEEAGFFVRFPGELTVVASMARRRDRPVFTKRALARFQAVEPVVRALVRQHWRHLTEALESEEAERADSPSIGRRLETAYRDFGSSILTEREGEIVRLLLRGHSSKSIARRLDVSPGTVKIHRKHIYRKLEISSQAELFSLFLSSLSDVGTVPGSGGRP